MAEVPIKDDEQVSKFEAAVERIESLAEAEFSKSVETGEDQRSESEELLESVDTAPLEASGEAEDATIMLADSELPAESLDSDETEIPEIEAIIGQDDNSSEADDTTDAELDELVLEIGGSAEDELENDSPNEDKSIKEEFESYAVEDSIPVSNEVDAVELVTDDSDQTESVATGDYTFGKDDEDKAELEKTDVMPENAGIANENEEEEFTEEPVIAASEEKTEEPQSDIMPEKAAVSEIDEVRSVEKSENSGPAIITESNRSSFSVPIIVGAAVLGMGLIGLGVFAYSLNSQIAELRTNLVALDSRIKSLEVSKEGKMNAMALFSQANERVNRLVTKVNRISNEVVDLKRKSQELSDNKTVETPLVKSGSFSGKTPVAQSQIKQMITEKGKKPDLITQIPSSKGAPEIVNNQQQGWVVNLVSVRDQKLAEKLRSEFQSKGVPTEQQKVEINGKAMYRLRAVGFATKREADKFGAQAIKKLRLKSFWVAR